MASKITLKNELAHLPLPATEKWPHGVWDSTPFRHGTMSLILFAPKIRDYQTPFTLGFARRLTQTLSFGEGFSCNGIMKHTIFCFEFS